MSFNFFNNHNNDDLVKIKVEAQQVIIDRYKLASYIAAGVVAASAMMALGGVGLLYFGKISEATLTTGVGALATMTSIQYAKQTKDELFDMLKDIKEDH
ncbi:TRADD-N-associated membrane domain-containing protein [Anabaena lutea]|uniref:Cyanobacterial TRADD-N associated 2 transmembrane domain-containing protein n=1 Tax=Anabaena lutea FACHB-196 TaxID=2692881 RepID=A0ABR8FE38_9NOST|nr:hypothetical protein [Anabaena lutea]MBD2567115.1 hypothetical protein [Anabaena lutea FACHB-196]